MTEVTQILNSINQGDPSAADKLLPLVYEELRLLARQRLAHENPAHTLQATALVHEAYLRLIGNNNEQTWDNRRHFFSAAAEAMRRILIESARKKSRIKRGGDRNREPLNHLEISVATDPTELLALNDALQKLELTQPRKAQLVKLRFFAGLTLAESAQALGISSSTADSDWAYARCWLRLELNDSTHDLNQE